MKKHKWLVLFLVYSDVTYKDNEGNVIAERNGEIDIENTDVLTAYKQDNFYRVVKSKLSNVKFCEEVLILFANNIEYRELNEIPSRTTVKKLDADNTFSDAFTEMDNKEISKISFSSGNDIQRLFFLINEKFSPEHKLIFTYGHGSAFGIFKDAIELNEEAISLFKEKQLEKSNTKNNKKDSILNYEKGEASLVLQKFIPKYHHTHLTNLSLNLNTQFVEQIYPKNETDFVPFAILTNEDLAHAITTSFGTVDILIMDNCLMQNVYAQYAFKDAITYLIAPQSGIKLTSEDMIGYNIDYFLNNCLTNYNGDISPAMLSREIIHGFNIIESETQSAEFRKFVVLSINLPQLHKEIFPILKESIKEIYFLMKHNRGFLSQIMDALGNCYAYESETLTGTTMIDFLEFISQITIRMNYKKINKFQYNPLNASEFILMIEKFKSNYKNFSLFIGSDIAEIYKKGELLSSMCIYFPKSKSQINRLLHPFYVNKGYSSSFDIITGWNKILEYYFDNSNVQPR